MLQVAVLLLHLFLQSFQVFAQQTEYGGAINIAIVLRDENFEGCRQVLNIFTLPPCLHVSWLLGDYVLKTLLISTVL